MQQKINISHFALEGDSLTDRGEMSHRYFLGLVSMNYLSGLAGKSPLGRFSNRFTWADHFIGMVIDDFKKKLMQASNSDEIANDEKLMESHYFDHYQYISYQGHQDFVRCYAEGGLTSHDYSWRPSTSIRRFFSRLILTTLGEMRERLLDWDCEEKVSKKQKAQTLVIEWSGANDLITVNKKPSYEEVQLAVKDRKKNVKKLIKKGYRNFVLFNLPDLSLTPRFQNEKMSQKERDNASQCCMTFNEELEKARKELAETYPHCSIDIFDVSKLFKEVYDNPQDYGFDADKKNKSYCDSLDFKDKINDLSADKYMFWNDVHPSDRLHDLLAKRFKEKFQIRYDFVTPKTVDDPTIKETLNISSETLLKSFRKRYEEKFNKDASGCFGFFSRSKIDYENASLEKILRHALYERGSRTYEVIKDLQWINHKGEINLNIEALKEAMTQAASIRIM